MALHRQQKVICCSGTGGGPRRTDPGSPGTSWSVTYAPPARSMPPPVGATRKIFTVDPRRYEQRYGQDTRYRNPPASTATSPAGTPTSPRRSTHRPAPSCGPRTVLPEFGGDTTWTNLVAAYQGLSEPRPGVHRHRLRAEHRYGGGHEQPPKRRVPRRVEGTPAGLGPPGGPGAPGDGERARSSIPGFTSHILDVSPRENRALLDLLYAELTPARIHRAFRWRPGSVAFLGQPSHRPPGAEPISTTLTCSGPCTE